MKTVTYAASEIDFFFFQHNISNVVLWKAYADKKTKDSFLCLKEAVSIYLVLGFWHWTYTCALPLLNFLVEANSFCLKEGGSDFR